MSLFENLDLHTRSKIGGDQNYFKYAESNNATKSVHYIWPSNVLSCDLNDSFEVYTWRSFVSEFGPRSSDVVTWEKIDSCYYKAYLKNGSVIFYDTDDKFYHELTEEEAKFKNEIDWRREFSRRLIRAMNRKGINQYDLSDMTGCSQASISNYISCKRSPSSFAVYLFAKALDCTVEYLTHF